MSWTNSDALHRHACHAYEDFCALRRKLGGDDGLWHSLSHHLRHAVHRSSHEVDDSRVRVKNVRRANVASKHADG
jgi:hypothetical protein